MTLNLKPTLFTTSPDIKLQEGDIYFIKIIVDKIQRRIYKVKGQNIRHLIFNQPQQFISLTGEEYFIEIKLFQQDNYQTLNLIAQTHVQKENIIREKQLSYKKNKQAVSCEIELNPVSQNSQKNDKMAKELYTFKIQLEFKFDKYKKILGRMKKNTNFLEELNYLDEDLQSLQRLSIHAASRPRPSLFSKDRILPPDTKFQSTIDSKIGNLYIGSCYSKNMFSFLDRDNNEHIYSIIEPQYH